MENFHCPGWESRFDPRTGRFYFVDLYNKITTWDDPRLKYKSHGGTSSQVSSETGTQMHGSPYHVYPASSSIYPAQAFQNPPSGVPSVNASPYFGVKMQQHHNQMEMSSMRSVPLTPRMGQLIRQQQQHQSTQETSFTNPVDVDLKVAKISGMFPTVDENHIRLLLKKYHNRDAVVISALQVEKHPLTTPGPYTPPSSRHFHSTAIGVVTAFQMTPQSGRRTATGGTTTNTFSGTSSNGSPIPPRPNSCASGSYYGYHGYYGSPRFADLHNRGSPKPHSSPKMKLRYLKSMFPKCEETIILDVLANTDNNVQKASEQMKRMGYEKRETAAPKLSSKVKEDKTVKKFEEPTPPPKIKTSEEKKKLKAKLQSQFKDIAEKIISMALESVDYSEEKACKILDIVTQEDLEEKKDGKKKSDNLKKSKKSGEGTDRNVSFKDNSPNHLDDDAVAEIDDGEIEEETLIINCDNEVLLTKSSDSEIEHLNDGSSSAQLLSPSVVSKSKSYNHKHHPESPYSTSSTDSPDGNKFVNITLKQKHCRPKAKKDAKHINEKIAAKAAEKDGDQTKENQFKTLFSSIQRTGPNPKLCKGANDELLLTDYVTWNGANPDFCNGRKNLAKGANSSLRVDRVQSCGRNKDLCKGPTIKCKGSMYLNRPLNDVVCN